MQNSDSCPCCLSLTYEQCCKPYHDGALCPTAEKLMRSRYTAYVLCLPTYLIATTFPSKRKGLSEQEIIDWSTENKWTKLEIVKASKSMVEFKAHFTDAQNQDYVHHELSTFSFDKGKWYYVKGSFY